MHFTEVYLEPSRASTSLMLDWILNTLLLQLYESFYRSFTLAPLTGTFRTFYRIFIEIIVIS